MADEPDYSTLPLEERLVHSVWKARLTAYEETGKLFEGSRNENDACFHEYNTRPELLKKFITDANVVAQEAALLSFTKFLKYGGTPTNVAKLKSIGIVTSIVEKGLSSSRAKTKEYAIESVLLLIEISNEPNGIVEELFPSLKNRLPKLVAGVVVCLYSIIRSYGCKSAVSPKPIIPHLSKLFGHADKTVRAETTKLTVELYKWMGQGLEMVLFPELKPVQQKELTKAFDALQGTTVEQTRFTRREQAQRIFEAEEAAAAAAAAEANGSDPSDGDVEMVDANDSLSTSQAAQADPYEFVDPVEVLSKLPADLSTRINEPKWKDRKEVLDEVYATLSKTVKLMPHDDYGPLIRIFAKCMKDANIQVVQLAANCCDFIVKGIGKEFHKYQAVILAPMIDRLKEKKASVATALSDTLDSIFKISSFADVLEDIFTGMKHKTPQVKIASTNYLQRCLCNTKIAPTTSEIDSIMEVGVKLLSESQEPIRQASTEMIGTLMKITGERELNSFLEKIDDNRKAKVHAFYETVSVNSKYGAPAPKAPPAQKKSSASSNVGRKLKPNGTQASSSSSSSSIPAKRGATSPAKRVDEAPKVSSFGRGLTGRSLASNTTPAAAPVQVRQPPVESISSADKEELAALRKEKQQWIIQQQKEVQAHKLLQEENSDLSSEISQLRAKTEYISKDHSTALLMIKQKETQILRLNSDLESGKLKIRDLEQTIELMKLQQYQHQQSQQQSLPQQQPQQYQQQYAPTQNPSSYQNRSSVYGNTPSSTYDPSKNVFRSPESRPNKISPGELSSRVNRLSIDGDAFKENALSSNQSTGYSKYSSPQRPQSELLSPAGETSEPETANDDSWKRAAEVTSQLKARIEKMKARSRNSTLNL